MRGNLVKVWSLVGPIACMEPHRGEHLYRPVVRHPCVRRSNRLRHIHSYQHYKLNSSNNEPAGNGNSTPTPIQTEIATNCNTFCLVKANDECATSKGISLTNFYSWNSAVRSSCGSPWLDTCVCVNVIGGTTGVSTPSTQNPRQETGPRHQRSFKQA